MSTAEEAEQERRVFEDDDDDDSSDTDDSDDDDDDADADGQAASTSPLQQPQTAQSALDAAASGELNPSAPSLASVTPNPSSIPDADPVLSEPAAAPPQNGAIPVQVFSSDSSLFTPTSSVIVPIATASASDERRTFAVVAMDDSRRLFQRLWTDEEEVKILQGFYEFTSRRGTTFASHQYDTGPFYEEIKKQLQFDFTKNQLIEKLRRLKKKYRNCVSRMQSVGKDFAFKSGHERAIYDIARRIWSASTKRAHDSDDEELNTPNTTISSEIITVPINDGSLSSERRITRTRRRMRRRITEEAAAAVAPVAVGVVENSAPVMQPPLASAEAMPNVIEETVKSCLSPLFKELINSAIGGPLGPGISSGTSPLNLLPLSLGGGSLAAPGSPVDEKWRKQQILELEVYLKRIELVRDHIKATLEELKTARS